MDLQKENIAVIIEQLNNITRGMDNLTKAVDGLDTRLSAVEISNAALQVGLDKDIKQLCLEMGKHDGFATESRVDRLSIRQQLEMTNSRVSKLEWSVNLVWVGTGLIFGAVILDLVTRFMRLV